MKWMPLINRCKNAPTAADRLADAEGNARSCHFSIRCRRFTVIDGMDR